MLAVLCNPQSRLTLIALAIMCLASCHRSNHVEESDSNKPVVDYPHCLLGTLAIQACFDDRDGVLIASTPIVPSEHDIKTISSITGFSISEVAKATSQFTSESHRWDVICSTMVCIDSIWDGADKSGLFPHTNLPSLRAELSTPIYLGEDTAVIVAGCTDCQLYCVVKLVVLERGETWFVRSVDTIAFV